METAQKAEIRGKDYFSNAMLMFLALSMDFIVHIGVNNMISDASLYKHVVSNMITIIIWSLSIHLMFRYIKRNNLKELFNYNKEAKSFILFGVVFILLMVVNLIVKEGNSPQTVNEFFTFKDQYNEFGIITYIAQTLYYLLEALLITLIVIFGQRWGEKKFHIHRFPYGGLVLSFTWGLIHILSKDLVTGIYGVAISIILGIGFIAAQKNIVLTYLLALVIFII